MERFDQERAEGVGGELAEEAAAVGDADVAGLLGDDDDDRVGFLAHADGGAVPAAELAVDVAGLGEGELNAGEHDATLADDDAEVVEGGVGPEDRVEQGGGELGVEAGAALGDAAEGDLAFDGDDGADLSPGEEGGGIDEGLDVLVDLLRPVAEEASLADAHQRSTNLGLEDHDRGKRREEEQAAVQEFDAVQFQLFTDQPDDQVEDDEEEPDALEHAGAAGAAEEAEDGVDERSEER